MKHFLVGLGIGIIFLLYYLRIGATMPFRYYDEAWWIGNSYFYDLLLHDRDNPLWDTVYSYDQPKLTHYVFGAILYPRYLAQRQLSPQLTYINYLKNNHLLCRECISGVETIGKELFDKEIKTEQYKGTREIILHVRKLNAFIAAATVAIMYFLGVSLWGMGGGLVLALFYGFNGLIIRTTLLAHADALYLFFFSAAILVLYKNILKNNFQNAIFFGICTGFAASTKIIGFMLVYLFILFQATKPNLKKFILHTLSVVVLSIVIFILFNPYLQNDTISRLITMYQYRVHQQQLFMDWFPLDKLPDLWSRVRAMVYFNLSRALPFQILFVVGLVSLNIRLKRLFIPIAGLVIVLSTLMWVTVSWERYFAHLVWVVAGIQTEGLLFLMRNINGDVRRKWSSFHF